MLKALIAWFIKTKWGQKLPSVFHQMAGAAVPSVPGLVKKPMSKKNRVLDLAHLVDRKYSQTLHSGDEGLQYYIESAMEMVSDDAELMPNPKIRAAFLKQNIAKTAAESCMVISPYIYFLMTGVQVPKYEMYYIQSTNQGAIADDVNKRSIAELANPKPAGNFCWLPRRSIGLVKVWMPKVKEIELKHNPQFTNVNDMVADFKKTGFQIGLIRKGNGKTSNTHTHLCYWSGGDLLNADQYHHDETGKPVKSRYRPDGPNKSHPETLWYLYAYK